MVVVAVAENDGVGLAESDAQGLRIRPEDRSLPGVEKHAPRAGFDPEREAVLAEHPAQPGRIVDEGRDANDAPP